MQRVTESVVRLLVQKRKALTMGDERSFHVPCSLLREQSTVYKRRLTFRIVIQLVIPSCAIAVS